MSRTVQCSWQRWLDEYRDEAATITAVELLDRPKLLHASHGDSTIYGLLPGRYDEMNSLRIHDKAWWGGERDVVNQLLKLLWPATRFTLVDDPWMACCNRHADNMGCDCWRGQS